MDSAEVDNFGERRIELRISLDPGAMPQQVIAGDVSVERRRHDSPLAIDLENGWHSADLMILPRQRLFCSNFAKENREPFGSPSWAWG
jgi:hypothetical protein